MASAEVSDDDVRGCDNGWACCGEGTRTHHEWIDTTYFHSTEEVFAWSGLMVSSLRVNRIVFPVPPTPGGGSSAAHYQTMGRLAGSSPAPAQAEVTRCHTRYHTFQWNLDIVLLPGVKEATSDPVDSTIITVCLIDESPPMYARHRVPGFAEKWLR